MLCTSNKTYAVRSVVLSNTVLVVTPEAEHGGLDIDMNVDEGDGADVDNAELQRVCIRDQLNEVLELVPTVPRLHKLSSLLRGMEYDEGREDLDEEMTSEDDERPDGRPVRASFTCDVFRFLISYRLSRGSGRSYLCRMLRRCFRPATPSSCEAYKTNEY